MSDLGHFVFNHIMPPQLRLNAVAFVSPQNHPILIKTFSQSRQDELKYHYIAHTSLDVIEERSESFSLSTNIFDTIELEPTVSAANTNKSTECYLGLLYVEEVAVYGYMTPLKVKIIIAIELTDSVVRDADVIAVSSVSDAWSILPALILAIRLDIQVTAHRLPTLDRKSVSQTKRTSRQWHRPCYPRQRRPFTMESVQ